jgi:hypothetical protein
MDNDGEQANLSIGSESVMWHASIGCYRIVCSVTLHRGEPSAVTVFENGQMITQEELAAGLSPAGVREVAQRLSERYAPRVISVANQTWRFGGTACLTTSACGHVPVGAETASSRLT